MQLFGDIPFFKGLQQSEVDRHL